MGVFRSDRIVHDVDRGSNLDLILRGFNGAVNRFADVLGHGLEAIATALATPHDNSQQVQEVIDKLRQVRTNLKSAIDQSKEN
jgi:ABC-type transporter Mla subunit MlaD